MVLGSHDDCLAVSALLGRRIRSAGLARDGVAAGSSVHPFHPATKFRGHGGGGNDAVKGDVVPVVWGSAGCLHI